MRYRTGGVSTSGPIHRLAVATHSNFASEGDDK